MQTDDDSDVSRRVLGTMLLGAFAASVLKGCTEGTADDENVAEAKEFFAGGTRLDFASAIGILPTNSATTNAATYDQWRLDNSDSDGDISVATTLIFDIPGTYLFPPDRLIVPPLRVLIGVDGVTLKCASPGVAGSFLVFAGALGNLTLDGDSKVDYVYLCGDPPPGAGPSASLSKVTAKNALKSCIFGLMSNFNLLDCETSGGEVGIYLRSCGESVGRNLSGTGHSVCFMRIEGKFGLPPEEGLEGGRMSLAHLSSSGPGIGLEVLGVGQCDVHGITVASTSANPGIRIARRATNIQIYGATIVSGQTAVEFDGCDNSYVWGGCAPGSKVVYKKDALGNETYACRAFLGVESPTPPSADVLHEWTTVTAGGTTTWRGYVRPDGTVLSGPNNTPPDGPPNAGHWRVADRVLRNPPQPGQPIGWVCTGAGNPPVFQSLPNL
jgi:hypothetical protein